jgi:electron transfer flavoprotein alpha subunit
MGEIMVVIEHRQGKVRDISLEILSKADELCNQLSFQLTAAILASDSSPIVDGLKARADRFLVFEDERLANFEPERYTGILNRVIREERPFLTLMGHTPWGMDLAPALAVRTGYPLATDCSDLSVEGGKPSAVRQILNGKVFSRVGFKDSEGYLITARPGAFPPGLPGTREGRIEKREIPQDLPEPKRRFVSFEDTGSGAVDITQADLLVSVGRGVGDAQNIPAIQALAALMGGVVSCSRPVVDLNWLPKYHQVGTSGKTVSPKVYLALGISGAFQHVAGIAGAGTIIAVNKDRKAPIFRVAHYGVAEDLFTIVDALKEKAGTK